VPQPTSTDTTSEVTGIRSAIAHLDKVAAAHAAHAGDEGFIGSLNRMEVGDDDQGKVRAAQEQSRNAGALWADAAQSVREHNLPVGEAYSVSPGAGNKQANTNE
jgi:hypothetical protein